MPPNRRAVRRTGALTRASVRRGREPRAAQAEEAPGRLRYLTSPTAWLVGILLTVATVTFQDLLAASVKTILPLDRVPDRLSPQNAIDVVEVRDVKDTGWYVVRDDAGGQLLKALHSDTSWRQGRRVVDVRDAEWMITLQGRAAQQVRITDIVPELEGGSCKAPLGGSLVHFPSQGVTGVIPLEVAVDSPRPRLKAYGKDGKAAEPFFTGPQAKHITLNQNETEAFLIHATSEKGYCRWRYRVHYEVGGTTAEMTLSGPHGRPFELTGELRDTSGYRNVYFPPLACVYPGSHMPDRWYEQTGAEYARDRRSGKVPPCPKS
ncbi:hypothetical protein QWM81_28810 [Streptomyces ficellus]|uniref:Uncharacterized protein n=1 Tax=Streptomyces ficellus TaxID=1977088 RepID=A0ABT7ZEN8_9ACTN|nr:hypothetical protein [Streptomyces ficellus]MDN3297965.1 hypothetical protein [Streptomyces ficellus]